jgi:hypothetical protein
MADDDSPPPGVFQGVAAFCLVPAPALEHLHGSDSRHACMACSCWHQRHDDDALHCDLAVTEGKRKGRWADDDDDEQPAGRSASGTPSSAEDGELPQGAQSSQRSSWCSVRPVVERLVSSAVDAHPPRAYERPGLCQRTVLLDLSSAPGLHDRSLDQRQMTCHTDPLHANDENLAWPPMRSNGGHSVQCAQTLQSM